MFSKALSDHTSLILIYLIYLYFSSEMYDHWDESFLGAFGRAEKEAFQEVQVSKIFN